MNDLPARTGESELQLVELVNRVLDRGVVVSGEIVIGVAGVDLIMLEIALMLSSVETVRRVGGEAEDR